MTKIFVMFGFNTQPPEGGWNITKFSVSPTRGFNTQPPEGGWRGIAPMAATPSAGFNTQPPEGGWFFQMPSPLQVHSFQHTAARRRLVVKLDKINIF